MSLVIPMGGGSGGDTGSRILANAAGKHLKKTIIVENRPGAETMDLGPRETRAMIERERQRFTAMVERTGYLKATPGRG